MAGRLTDTHRLTIQNSLLLNESMRNAVVDILTSPTTRVVSIATRTGPAQAFLSTREPVAVQLAEALSIGYIDPVSDEVRFHGNLLVKLLLLTVPETADIGRAILLKIGEV